MVGVRGKTNWTAVAFYYVVACAVSFPFFWWRDIHPESWRSWHFPNFLKTSTIMWGPGIAALISLYVFRKSHRRTITVAGSSVWRSAAFYGLPILLLATAGVESPDGSVNHALPLLIGVVGLFNILGEELGWRGFLQDALRPLPMVARYVLIGVMWEFWHFTNRTAHGSPKEIALRLLIAYPVVIILSFIISEATERSKSLLVAVTLHAWLDLLFEFSGKRTYVVFVISILLWTFLLTKWRKN
jgi:membrane protease YdiL (CAAX protease family)